MTNFQIGEALASLRPGAAWALQGDDISAIEWLDERQSRPTDAEITAQVLAAYAAYKRWSKEVGGILVNGIPIATDDRSKLMITGARVAAAADSQWVTTWLGTDGKGYPVNASAMVTISNEVADHVNQCFAIYAEVIAKLKSGQITTTDQIDIEFA